MLDTAMDRQARLATAIDNAFDRDVNEEEE
jgi:hypothetical protein